MCYTKLPKGSFRGKWVFLGIISIRQDPDWFQMDSRLVVISKGRAQITSGALGQCFCIELPPRDFVLSHHVFLLIYLLFLL